MTRRLPGRALAVLLGALVPVLAGAGSARAGATPPGRSDPVLCAGAISSAEQVAGLPPRLLHAIGVVESGRRDPKSGLVRPWPWTINVQGQGYFFDNESAAVSAVQALQEAGITSIDVGCLQINLHYHPTAFSSLDQAFDPQANAAYGARFLRQLYGATGDWTAATAAYHSTTAEIGAGYARKVAAVRPAPDILPGDPDAVLPDAAALETELTPEFSAQLARDAADRAALLAAMRPAPSPAQARRRRDAAAPKLPRHAASGGEATSVYTAEFASRLAEDAATRAAIRARLRGQEEGTFVADAAPAPDAAPWRIRPAAWLYRHGGAGDRDAGAARATMPVAGKVRLRCLADTEPQGIVQLGKCGVIP